MKVMTFEKKVLLQQLDFPEDQHLAIYPPFLENTANKELS